MFGKPVPRHLRALPVIFLVDVVMGSLEHVILHDSVVPVLHFSRQGLNFRFSLVTCILALCEGNIVSRQDGKP